MRKIVLAASFVAIVLGGAANAAVFNLDFEGSSMSASPGSTAISIGNFYNGGTDSGGASGTNYGVSFTNANFDSFSSQNGLYNIPSAIAYMPASPLTFTSARAFTALALDQFFFGGGNILTIYDGANGTGNVLGSVILGQNCTPNCTPVRNNITFAGLGRSATLQPNANNTGIDNLTITAVPEPATWALMIGGFGLVGGAMRRRRHIGRAVRFA